jgi:CxxC-x17-CxxC domain-containing protein
MYLLGKTGVGKTTLMKQMILSDIYNGNGVGLVDPHGDFVEDILNYIPKNRVNDVVYFNPSDVDFPVGFNVLESIDPRHKHLVASGLMGVFKKIWPDVWSPRMEYILNNCILALLDYPGSTLLGINRLLVDKDYRKRVVAQIQNPVVKTFWVSEYARYSEKFATEAIAPIQNKVGQFLSSSIIRNIVAQVKSTINIRDIMDGKKIFLMNLSKGRIGEDSTRLLGGMLVTKLQLGAMERVDIAEKDRQDFFLYVDEFQNFATESFANILSEARKYRLDLIMAHQYITQLEEEVAAAVFGNIGTLVCFRVGAEDAEFLAKEFAPDLIEEDLVNLPKYNMYLKLMIDGVSSAPFSASTFVSDFEITKNIDKVIQVSRERYAESRTVIEEKIMRWSGMDESGEMSDETDENRPANSGGSPSEAKRSVGGKMAGVKRYPAVCSECKADTDVPFVPDGSRPVLCVDCYKKVMSAKKLAPQKTVAKPTPTRIQLTEDKSPKAISLSQAFKTSPPPRVKPVVSDKVSSDIGKTEKNTNSKQNTHSSNNKILPNEVVSFE